MPLKPEQLPDDIAELKRRLIETTNELAAAKNGLIVNQLTIEKLKAQIAKLRRSKFGASSERIERALEQLELALEEAETAKAEAVAAQPQQPEPEAANAEAQPAEEAKPGKKKRRQLPPEFPRRDVVHRPPGVCKTCGGSELRTVSETVTPSTSPRASSTSPARSSGQSSMSAGASIIHARWQRSCASNRSGGPASGER